MSPLYLGTALCGPATTGDVFTALCCGIVLGLLPWLFL